MVNELPLSPSRQMLSSMLPKCDRHCAVNRSVPPPEADTVSGAARAARTKAPATSTRVRLLFAITEMPFDGSDSGSTIACRGLSCSEVVATRLFEQAAPVSLHRDEVAEQGVIFVSLLDRRHPLQLRLDLRDLPADP